MSALPGGVVSLCETLWGSSCATMFAGSRPFPAKQILEVLDMRPLKRKPVNKYKSAGKFKKMARRTKGRNVIGPMRGGIRL